MKIRHIYKVYFSPTGTTKQVVSAIADVMAQNLSARTFTFDFTLPQARAAAQDGSPAAGWPAAGAEDLPAVSAGDLVVFGCPTYAGRLPNLLLKYLNTIEGSGALALPVVTFGNRNFDNSLIELRDLLEDRGFHTAAAAACSCEHSFSYVLGAGRPDEKDLEEIRCFALQAAEKVKKMQAAADHAPVQVPGIPAKEGHGGYYQPRDRHGVFIDIRKVKPLADPDRCLRFAAPDENVSGRVVRQNQCADSGVPLQDSALCGVCAAVCPMGAIDPSDITQVPGICIKCGACIKKCPGRARYYDDPGYLYHKSELEELYSRRADNAFFL